MKKTLLLISILVISVASTACINNFAVQELNNKARLYLEKGDYQEAIARLKSSLDLDNTSFETYYNLAAAYSKTEDYVNAAKSYAQAVKLNPEFADAYYSLAVSEQNLVKLITDGFAKLNEQGQIIYLPEREESDDSAGMPYAQRKLVNDLLKQAVADYQTYLNKSPNAQDRQEVENEILHLKEISTRYIIDEALSKRL
ncbi:MAG: tetratricopeptide repeat protein [Heliobacteriaceae bacterium]|jgi:cytochrome c-type biogenesis protein CcmH/NrfG|nr:tetratricopeptide repeat protein [Heliobacteriaceae bacterium]